MGCIRRRNQSHSPGCIVIHCARIHPLRFWRVCRGVVTCFTRFPSETRSGRLSGARNEALCSMRVTGGLTLKSKPTLILWWKPMRIKKHKTPFKKHKTPCYFDIE